MIGRGTVLGIVLTAGFDEVADSGSTKSKFGSLDSKVVMIRVTLEHRKEETGRRVVLGKS